MTQLWLATGNAVAALSVKNQRCAVTLHLKNLPVRCVAIDPLRPDWVYCGTFGYGIFYSADSGQNWRRSAQAVSGTKVLAITVSRLERVNAGGVVYAGTEPSTVLRSQDAGENWRECSGLRKLASASQWSFPPRPETHHVRWIETDPHHSGRLFVAIEAGALVRSPNGGSDWQDRVPDGPRDTHQLRTSLAIPGRLVSAAGDGCFESLDSGDTWQRIEEGLQHRYVWSIAVDVGDPETMVVSSAAGPRESHDRDRAESFLYRRTARSAWQPLHDGLPSPSGRRTAVLAAHPSRPGTFFAAWENELYRSTDGGIRWHRLEVAWPEEFLLSEPSSLIVEPE